MHFVHLPLVTGIIECSRLYVLSNLLGMLTNGYMALTSKLYFLDCFDNTDVPMLDISGYIWERVKDRVWDSHFLQQSYTWYPH